MALYYHYDMPPGAEARAIGMNSTALLPSQPDWAAVGAPIPKLSKAEKIMLEKRLKLLEAEQQKSQQN